MGEPLGVRFFGHACLRLDLGGARVLTDPLLTRRVGPLRWVAPAPPPRPQEAAADVVLLSHLHSDHVHLPSLRRLPYAPLLVGPPPVVEWLRRQGFRRLRALAPGESCRVEGVDITAVPAAHDGRRWPVGPPQPAAGFLVAGGGQRVYFAGDTGLFDELDELAGEAIDLALLPVWGWGPTLGPGHLDPTTAAEAAQRVAARAVLPMHWGALAPPAGRWVMGHLLHSPPRQFAAEVARRSPATSVFVAEPGERVLLEPASRQAQQPQRPS